MTGYRVAFDGKWQGDFDDALDAEEWARAVGETGRIVHVVRLGFRRELIAVFPEDQREEGERLWKIRGAGAGGGGG
jgi:hypothetical protein